MKSKILLFTAAMLLTAANTFSQVVANFTCSDSSGCAPLTVNFIDTSTGSILTWTWDFGDGGTASIASPTHTYSVPGIYTVSLRVGSFNGTDTLIKVDYINVLASPTAGFTSSSDSVCLGDTIHFVNTTVPGAGLSMSYVWTFNDGSPSEGGINADHSFLNLMPVTQMYTTLLIATDDNGCSDSYADTVFISPVPSAGISISSTSPGGIPLTVNFSNNSIGFAVYNWDFGDPGSGVNNVSALASPSHIYDSLGVFEVVFTIGIPGCQAQDTLLVDVNSIVGIEDPMEIQTRIYPNPAADFLVMETFGEKSQSILRIYDLSGRIVLEREALKDGNKLIIDVSALGKGVYLLQCGNFHDSFEKN